MILQGKIACLTRPSRLMAAALLMTSLLPLGAAQAEQAPVNTQGNGKVITLRADPSCPSNCEPDAERPGYDVELAKAIFGAAGYQVDYRLLSWSRTLIEVREGNIDGFVAGIKADAPDFVFPEEPAGVLVNGFVLRKGVQWKWDGAKSLNGKVLGYIPDYQYFPELKSYIDAHAKEPNRVQGVAMMNATELNLKKLLVGRIDLYADDIAVLQYTIGEMKLKDKLEITPPVGERVSSYIAFGPTNPHAQEYARIWDDGMRRLRANGELKRILDRYNLTDWK